MVRRASLAHHWMKVSNHPEQVSPKGERAEGLLSISDGLNCMGRKISPNERRLMKRYLIWCYKTTKEDLDRVDRKFTQLIVDNFLLNDISKNRGERNGVDQKSYDKAIKDFRQYMAQKELDSYHAKFADRSHARLQANYVYLRNRLAAIEKAIIHFLGKKELMIIQSLYEEEMTRRILEAREHT